MTWKVGREIHSLTASIDTPTQHDIPIQRNMMNLI